MQMAEGGPHGTQQVLDRHLGELAGRIRARRAGAAADATAHGPVVLGPRRSAVVLAQEAAECGRSQKAEVKVVEMQVTAIHAIEQEWGPGGRLRTVVDLEAVRAAHWPEAARRGDGRDVEERLAGVGLEVGDVTGPILLPLRLRVPALALEGERTETIDLPSAGQARRWASRRRVALYAGSGPEDTNGGRPLEEVLEAGVLGAGGAAYDRAVRQAREGIVAERCGIGVDATLGIEGGWLQKAAAQARWSVGDTVAHTGLDALTPRTDAVMGPEALRWARGARTAGGPTGGDVGAPRRRPRLADGTGDPYMERDPSAERRHAEERQRRESHDAARRREEEAKARRKRGRGMER